jgi:hypothetical protein
MNSKHLHRSGAASRRLILLPEERTGEERMASPRIRRYRLSVLSGQSPAKALAREAKLAPPSLARALRA